VVAVRLAWTDHALSSAERSIATGNVADAAAAYHRAVDLRNTGLTADLYFSRRFARAAADSRDVLQKLYLGQLAAGSASLATEVPEGRPNAWFNLAELGASRSDSAVVETALRAAITESPNWFKPHWVLARLLFLQGRNEAAWQESQRAMQLNQKDPEVSSTLAPILSFRRDPSHSPSP
jgi:tetratricopeptide (TPR) repeat protein